MTYRVLLALACLLAPPALASDGDSLHVLFPEPGGLEYAPAAPRPLLGGSIRLFPVDGLHSFTDTFGQRRPGGRRHAGTDIMARKRTPVVAVADGVVDWLLDARSGRCCAVGVRHDNGESSRYIHLNNDTPGTDDGRAVGIAPGVKLGSRVRAGQLLGWVGDSGNAEDRAPHLHFELRSASGRPRNPYPLLRRAAGPPRPGPVGAPVADGDDVVLSGAPRVSLALAPAL